MQFMRSLSRIFVLLLASSVAYAEDKPNLVYILVDKWHLGEIEGRLPTDQGFDQWYGIKNTTDEAGYSSTPQFDTDVFPQPYIWEGKKGKPSTKVKAFNLDSRKTIDREIVEHSEAYIAKQAKKNNPFFLYMALTQVHPPLGHNPDFDNITGTGIYGDILTEVDYNVGRIVDALSKAGIADNTILILSGDNGAVTEGIGGGSNGPWRGGFTGYDVRNDPGEDNELMKHSLFAYSWVYGAMGGVLREKAASMQEYRNIKPGEDFEGYD